MILENNFKIQIQKFCLQSKEKPALFKRGSKSSSWLKMHTHSNKTRNMGMWKQTIKD